MIKNPRIAVDFLFALLSNRNNYHKKTALWIHQVRFILESFAIILHNHSLLQLIFSQNVRLQNPSLQCSKTL